MVRPWRAARNKKREKYKREDKGEEGRQKKLGRGGRARRSRKETRAEQVWRGDRRESRNGSSEWPGSGWVPRGPGGRGPLG